MTNRLFLLLIVFLLILFITIKQLGLLSTTLTAVLFFIGFICILVIGIYQLLKYLK
ncbi:MAG TPA: hypothetical protein VK037_09200 [Pseudogracilibacillus sp.]|nr:hypothetical protein [Pseudogracilibacillus sp.]